MKSNSKPEKPSKLEMKSIYMLISGILIFSVSQGGLIFQIRLPRAMWGPGIIFFPFFMIIGIGLIISGIVLAIINYRKYMNNIYLKDKYSDLSEYDEKSIFKGHPKYVFKICLIGSPAVGKTCIARRLHFNTFDNETKLTLGIEFYTKDIPIIVNGEISSVRLSIWEFGGQEHFKHMFPYYINGACGNFLVFDLANIETLTKLEWWYERLIDFNLVGLPKILIGTKLDLIDEESTQFKSDESVVKGFIKHHDQIDFIKTSAKENINIQDSFKELVKKILDYNKLNYEKLL